METITHLTDDINAGFNFGKKDTKKSFLSFSIKIMVLLIPGIILGYYIDKIVKDLYDKQKFGKKVIYYICIQTMLSITVLYTLSYMSHYTEEFQNTFAGLYFTAFFFGMQSNYITYLQRFLDN